MTTLHMNDPLVGHVLDGRYEITSRIARGGMATVYVAQDTRLARTVAVKIMHEGLGDDRDFTRKFDREARAAARLIHPNIVAVFDQGSDLGRPYIVMEHVAGQTMRSVISRDAPLPPLRALALMEPVLAALAVAHESGFVHRDVKPENVLISERGHVKVADFGLAKAISGDTVTATQGLLIGTVSYIPPELVAEGRADAHSDVYSAGIVLFELLTGRKPHTGDTPIQVAYAHCHKDVPAPSSVLADDGRPEADAIPAYLDALVRVATTRDPADRIPDARVFLERLRRARQALERGVVDDPALTAAMRGGDNADASREPSRWVARPRSARPLPATPISPVDLTTASRELAGYYDERPAGRPTPVERSLRLPRPPAVVTQTSRPRQGRPASAAGRPRRRRGLVALLLVLLLACGVGYGTWYALAGQFTQAPTLTGMTREDAEARAAASHLSLTVSDEFSEDVPAGVVLRTDPTGGAKVRAGGTLAVFVSKGPERYGVPRLVGLSQSAAEAAVTGAGLTVGAVTQQFDEAQPVGTVLRSSAEEGARVKKDTRVDLVVSRGPAPIAIPSLAGKAVDEAKATLTRLGFRVAITETNSKTVAKGGVISQTPEAGEGKKGDTITLVSSKGPVMVTVPNTRGMQQGPAKAALEERGFVVKIAQLPNPVPFGTVSYSDPAGGTQAPEGSTVTLYVA